MKRIFPPLLFALLSVNGLAKPQDVTENIIFITLDGFRWQEVFKGPDTRLMGDKVSRFFNPDTEVSRRLLLPFIWTEVARHGTIYGNRDYGSYVNLANKYWFSYPGYHELLTGNPNKQINSNRLGPDPDVTVLEKINRVPAFRDRIAVFSSWPVISHIVNESRSGILVNAGNEMLPDSLGTEVNKNIERITGLMPVMLGNIRYDGITFLQAFEYLKTRRPRVLMIAFGETDEFGHSGQYDHYLQSANLADKLIAELWGWIQSDTVYRNRTTLVITTDHGRGEGTRWINHGRLTPHSNETWIAMLGPSVLPMGEVKTPVRIFNAQVASSLAAMLNVPFNGADPLYSHTLDCISSTEDWMDRVAALGLSRNPRRALRLK